MGLISNQKNYMSDSIRCKKIILSLDYPLKPQKEHIANRNILNFEESVFFPTSLSFDKLSFSETTVTKYKKRK